MQTDNDYLIIKGDEGSDITIDFLKVKKTSLIFRALNNKFRQSILKLLEANDKLTVSQISNLLRIDQSVASLHLGILRRSSIVRTTREGKYIFYDLHHFRIAAIEKCSQSLLSVSK